MYLFKHMNSICALCNVTVWWEGQLILNGRSRASYFLCSVTERQTDTASSHVRLTILGHNMPTKEVATSGRSDRLHCLTKDAFGATQRQSWLASARASSRCSPKLQKLSAQLLLSKSNVNIMVGHLSHVQHATPALI